MLERFEGDVNNQPKKADADQPMRKCFSIVSRRSIAQSPHQHEAGSNFDHRINSKTDQRDTTSDNAGNNSDDRFERSPTDADEFNSATSPTMNSESFSNLDAHFQITSSATAVIVDFLDSFAVEPASMLPTPALSHRVAGQKSDPIQGDKQ